MLLRIPPRVGLAGILLLVTAVLLALFLPSQEGRRLVSVGLYENPPKVFTAAPGRPAGLFVELLEEIARLEGWRLRYVPCQWVDCLKRLERGELDLMPDVAHSVERARLFDFHHVSVASSWSQVYSNPSIEVRTLADLAGKRVAMLRGGIQQAFFRQLMAGGDYAYRAVLVDSLEQGYAAVLAGEADAVVTNSFFAARNGGKYALQETPIVFLPSTLYFATAKGRNAELLARIDARLRAWRQDSGSPYFVALHRAMAAAPEVLVPRWARWALVALVAGTVLLLALSLILRRQVEARTQSLLKTTRELEHQRANLEHLVGQRTAQLRAAKEEAERLSRVKSDFLANMSHEIRTPMNAILGMLYLALKSEMPAVMRNHLSKARAAALALLGIINDILDISKIEAGKLELEQTEFGLDGVLEQLINSIGVQAEQKGLEFLIRYDASIPSTLIGDPLRFGQILLNLCGNAVKFTERGEVELAFRCLEAEDSALTMQVCVRDSGIGMDAATVTRLFEKFSQADESTTRRFGGTGLGLVISKNLVEMMGGRIWVEATRPGKGSTICFTLRMRIAPHAQARRRQLVEQAAPLLGDIRVLVVDDNEVSREILAEMLGVFQIAVASAASGPAALAVLEQEAEKPFDLVLMDWKMPGMNGDEVTQRIHRSPAIKKQPKVVIVTAYGREDVIHLVEEAGAEGLLIKPVSPSTLLDTLLSLLGRGPLGVAMEAKADTRGAGHFDLAGMHLLLVEDNDINREFASELLRGEGITVDEAENGRIALAMVQENAYDAVLMDIQMPVMDGLEAARRMRALAGEPGGERFARLPIIAMTALAMAQDTEKSRAAGMNDHVSKPIAPERLLAVLAKWARKPARWIERRAAPGTEEIPPDLLALGSLDAREGIHRIGGRAEAYRRQLQRFRERYADAVGELRRLLAEQAMQQAAAYCHALKGVIGNLGAHALYDQISAIDARLKLGQAPEAEHMDTLDEQLSRLLREIAALEAEAPGGEMPGERDAPGTPLDPAELCARLTHLARSLEYDLGAVEPELSALRAALAGTPLAAEITALAERVDVFEIDAALEKIAALQNDYLGCGHERSGP